MDDFRIIVARIYRQRVMNDELEKELILLHERKSTDMSAPLILGATSREKFNRICSEKTNEEILADARKRFATEDETEIEQEFDWFGLNRELST